MNLPNFLCVGAQKSGTTTLHNILIQHPDVYLPEHKETKFFVDNEKFTKGINYYLNEFFVNWKGEKLIGEVDPDYMYFDYVPERIFKILGKNIKLIFILRNPIDRAYSHYLMTRARGLENLTFLEAIKKERIRISKSFLSNSHYSYISRGFYSKQIENFLNFFPKDNMFFVIFESEFMKNRKNTIKKMLEFLGGSFHTNLNVNIKSNSAYGTKIPFISKLIHGKPKWAKAIAKVIIPNKKIKNKIAKKIDEINKKTLNKKELSLEERIFLYSMYFKDEVVKLEAILQRDLTVWKEMI